MEGWEIDSIVMIFPYFCFLKEETWIKLIDLLDFRGSEELKLCSINEEISVINIDAKYLTS
jgi:hypothetical protein